MHMFLFLGASPDSKRDDSLRTSGLLRSSKTVRNGKQVSVFRKERLQLGRIRGVCFESIITLPCSEQPLSLE